MTKKVNVYITFYYYLKDPDRLDICNGFSFCRDKSLEYVDLFCDSDSKPGAIQKKLDDIANINKIYCSLSFENQYECIKPLIDNRWVLGGPFVDYLQEKHLSAPGEIVTGPFEYYLNKKLGTDFSYYFADFLEEKKEHYVMYTCGIGSNCYWNKCKFCLQNYSCREDFFRVNIDKILKQLPEYKHGFAYANLCREAVPPKLLKQILQVSSYPTTLPMFFIRADKGITKTIENNTAGCRNKFFLIGLESFSQTILDKIDKGIEISDLINIVDIILENDGYAGISLMDHYFFADENCVRETHKTIEKFKNVLKKHKDKTHRIWFQNNGPTIWPTTDCISPFINNTKFKKASFGYQAILDPNSKAFTCNKEMSLAIKSLGLKIYRNEFLSLASSDANSA